MKKGIRIAVLDFSWEIAKDLEKDLEEALNKSITTDVLPTRLALGKFFNAKHGGCFQS